MSLNNYKDKLKMKLDIRNAGLRNHSDTCSCWCVSFRTRPFRALPFATVASIVCLIKCFGNHLVSQVVQAQFRVTPHKQ